jgi:hypothetical protein
MRFGGFKIPSPPSAIWDPVRVRVPLHAGAGLGDLQGVVHVIPRYLVDSNLECLSNNGTAGRFLVQRSISVVLVGLVECVP